MMMGWCATCDLSVGSLPAVSQAEKDSLGERVDSLVSQLDQERSAHEEAMRQLQSQIAGENSRVQRLEEALQDCQKKLVQHMNTVTEADQQHRGSLQQVKGEVSVGGGKNREGEEGEVSGREGGQGGCEEGGRGECGREGGRKGIWSGPQTSMINEGYI